MQEQKKDPIIGFRSVKVGKDKKGADRIELFLGGDKGSEGRPARGNQAIEELIAFLQEALQNPNGCKLDVHIGERQTNDGRRTFLSAYAFLKFTEDRPGTSTTKTAWVPKGSPAPETMDRAAKVYRTFKD